MIVLDVLFSILVKGNLPNINKILSGIKNEDFKIVLAVDIMSLVIIEPPNPEKVDVVVGTTQRFGIPLVMVDLMQLFCNKREIQEKYSW